MGSSLSIQRPPIFTLIKMFTTIYQCSKMKIENGRLDCISWYLSNAYRITFIVTILMKLVIVSQKGAALSMKNVVGSLISGFVVLFLVQEFPDLPSTFTLAWSVDGWLEVQVAFFAFYLCYLGYQSSSVILRQGTSLLFKDTCVGMGSARKCPTFLFFFFF